MTQTSSGERSRIASVWWRGSDLEVVSGSGATVVTRDGTEYLDFTSGVGVTATGHCHPRVVEAIREQAGRFLHAQVNVYWHDLIDPLGEALDEVTPPSIDQFFVTNSGSEAIEGAVKLARAATGRTNVIAFQGGFHGRTAQAMAITSSKVTYRAGFGPLPAGAHFAPFPYPFRTGEEPEAAVARCLDAVRLLLRTQTAPSETAAILLEPILGEGGYVVPPPSFLQGLRELCDEHGIMLVLDEIQSGAGRTGRWWACEHSDVAPDILVMAKGIGSGFPVAAIGAPHAVMERWAPGSHGGTYGGNPLGCAAVLATIGTIRDEGLLDNATVRGAQLQDGLRALQARHPGIGDVRGRGLMVALELVDADGRPDAARTKAITQHAREEGRVIILDCGTDGNVIRLIPPLIIDEEACARALAALGAALDATG